MFTHLLIPVDGSKLAMEACGAAVDLAKSMKAKVTVLLVSPTYRQLTDEGYLAPTPASSRKSWENNIAERAQRVLDAAAAQARSAGVKCETVHVFKDQPYVAIIDAARKNGCDLIVMGSHGYGGLKQVVLGSETTRVLSHSKIPVLVYR